MKDWIKRTPSKKSSDFKNGLDLETSQTGLADKKNSANAKPPNHYLLHMLKPFRGPGKNKQEASPFKTSDVHVERIAEFMDNKADLEQILASIEMKVTSGSKKHDINDCPTSEGGSSLLERCSSVEILHKTSENPPPQRKPVRNREVKEVKFADEYCNVYLPQDEIEGVEEPIYSSKKLLMRQLIDKELKDIEIEEDDDRSTLDSWSEMEESFTKIYEPLPVDIEMDSWNNMSKEEILQCMSSQKLREKFEQLEHSDIICYIRNLNNLQSPVSQGDKITVEAQVHENGSVIDYDSGGSEHLPKFTSEIVVKSSEIPNFQNQDSAETGNETPDSLSWKSVSLVNSDAEEPCYVSRSEILSKTNLTFGSCRRRENIDLEAPSISSDVIHLPFPPVSRSAILQNVSKKNRRKRKEPKRDHEGGLQPFEDCVSSSSCDSWAQGDYPVSGRSSVVSKNSERSNWFAKTVMEQEERLRDIVEGEEVRKLTRTQSKDSWSFSECEEGNDSLPKLSRSQILNSNYKTKFKLKYLPALELRDRVENFLSLQSHIETPTKEKVMQILRDHIKQNSNADSLADAENKNEEIRERLKEALANDWENLSNVSLGFIYVPMEENTKLFKSSKETPDYDTFGSIDSLIFEPKSLSSIPSSVNSPNEAPPSTLRESPVVSDDLHKLNGSFSASSADLDEAHQLRLRSASNQMTQYLESSAVSTKSLSRNSDTAPERSYFELDLVHSDTATNWGEQRGIGANLNENSFLENQSDFLASFGDFELASGNTPPISTGYHPDNSKSTFCSDTTFASSSPDESGSLSETESVTSIESVIVNMKIKSSENNFARKPTAKKKYVVNRCHESDSNSDADRNSTQMTHLLDSDTSWDYIATPKKESFHSEKIENVNHSPVMGDFSNHYHEQFADYLANSHFHTTLAKELLEEEAIAQYESSDDTPKGTQMANIYELGDDGSSPSVVLLKHHVYQSIESLQSLSSIEDFVSVHSEPIYGATNDRIFKCMNGAYVDDVSDEHQFDDVPFLISKGAAVPLTEELFKGTLERNQRSANGAENECKSDTTDDLGSESTLQAFSPTVSNFSPKSESGENTNFKIKKVQKVGVSLMGSEKSDLMIQELKMKLRRKFISDQEEEESPLEELSSRSTILSCLNTAGRDGTSSIASMRDQIAPHIDRIFKSINSHQRKESLSTFSTDEGIGDITTLSTPIGNVSSEATSKGQIPEEFKVDDIPLNSSSSCDPSLVWLPTPDYTPLSTLPRELLLEERTSIPAHIFDNDYLQQDLDLNVEDLETFVRGHLVKASRANKSCESALATEESRAKRARSGSPKRSVRFDTSRKLPDLTFGATWSDLESVIFAEEKPNEFDASDGSGRPDSRLTNSQMGSKMPGTRMESYKDDWLLWDQLSKMRRSKTPEDRERWQSEKTKRMLLWVHLSNNNSHIEWCYKSHWWKAKQRASVAWIVQKCHKNKVPSDIEEPYYKDYDGLEHLKPGIVHRLSNADLYCSALANIYGDPNFHNLSHWNIIQALARKGVYVAEPTDVALTETVLIQTTPIKMSAHLAVIEAMMALYIREVVVAERVVQAIQRISGISQANDIPTPQDQEEALVLWVEHSTQALQSRIHQQVQQTQDQKLPVFPKIQDLSDLSDGIGLAALLAFYCPQELSWGDIAVADPPSMADSLYNIGLVIKFCKESLPYNPCLLTKEDIVYMHSSVKQNILAFVAELFFLMELEPVSCVSISNTRKTSTKYIQLSSPGCSGRYSGGNSGWSGYHRSGTRIIPDLRQSISPSSTPSAHSTHSTASSSSSTHSHHHHHHRSSYASSLRDCSELRSSLNKELRRQHSLSERERPRKERAPIHDGSEEGGCSPFNFGSIYPPWWWSCNHKSTDKECHYCLRQRQSQAFADQFEYFLSSTKSTSSHSPSKEKAGLETMLKEGELRGGFGSFLHDHKAYGNDQGISYTLPARDWEKHHQTKCLPPFQHRPASLRRNRKDHSSGWSNLQGMRPAGVPSVRRSHSMNLNDVIDSRSRAESRSENAPSSHNSDYGGRDSSMSDGQESEFLVQKAKGYATLNDMIRNQSPRPSQHELPQDFFGSRNMPKEKYNTESKEEELGERGRLSRRGSFHGSFNDLNQLPPAGIPTRLEHRPLGRSRSRRNSINAEESQLTIENFGGSQDNLNYISRNPDKEPYIHTGKKDSLTEPRSRRSSSQTREAEKGNDHHRPSLDELDNRVIDKLEKDALEREKRESSREVLQKKDHRRRSQPEQVYSSSESEASYEPEKPLGKATSFAELSKLKEQLPGGINIIYMQQSDRDDSNRKTQSSKGSEKKTTFAALPNQTTWKQQSVQNQVDSDGTDENFEPQVVTSELHNVRLKLEEKRRRIEAEKRKVELMMNKQRQKLGKEAFMQAVVKGDETGALNSLDVQGKGSYSTGSSSPTATPETNATDALMDSMEPLVATTRVNPTLNSSPNLPSSFAPLLPTISQSSQVPAQPILTDNSSFTQMRNPPILISPSRPNSIFSIKDLGTEVSNVSKKWLNQEGQKEEMRTPDMDAMDYDEYQKSLTQDVRPQKLRQSMEYHGNQSGVVPRPDPRRLSLYLEPGSSANTWYGDSPNPFLGRPPIYMPPLPPSQRRSSSDYQLPPPYRMTDSLNDIQSDIQRLSHQQHQIQALMQNGMVNQQNQFYLHDQQQGSPARRMWSQHSSSDGYSSMSPATRRAQWGPPARPMIPQGEYIMGGPPQQQGNYYPYQSPQQMSQPPHQLPPLNQLGQPLVQQNQGGFLLHGQPHSLPANQQPNSAYQNGQAYFSPEQYRGYQNPNYIVDPLRAPHSQGGSTPFRLHQDGGDDSRGSSSLRSSAQSSPSHQSYQGHQKSPSPSRQVSHAPVAAPPPDDMEPQNVCFIEEQQQNKSDVNDKLKRLSISSGSRTYRISHEPGSPTRPPIGTKTFRVPTKRGTPVFDDSDLPQPSPPQRSMSPPYTKHNADDIASDIHIEPLVEGPKADKGFYISLDDEGPKRPKPPLRTKKLYQKKSSGSLTPLTTPTSEDALPIYHDQEKENDITPIKPTYGSLKFRRSSSNRALNPSATSPLYPVTSPSHFTSRSDITLSPSSSVSSVPRESTPSSYWNPEGVVKSGSKLFQSRLNNSRYNFDDSQLDGSDSGSELGLDESVKRVHKKSESKSTPHGMALVIGEDLVNEDSSLSEMEKKKEKLMMMSIRRKQQQEEMKRNKEIEAELKREEEKRKEDEKMRKKEDEKARRELILERHKIKKAIEEAEKEGRYYAPPAWYYEESSGMSTPNSKSSVRLRNRGSGGPKPRPKTMHEASFSGSDERLSSSRGKKGSSSNIAEPSSSVRKSNGRWGSSGSLSRAVGNRGSTGSLGPDCSSSSLTRGVDKGHSGRRPTSMIGVTPGSLVRRERSRGSLYGSRGLGLDERDEESYQVHETRRPSIASNRRSRLPCYDGVTGRKYRSTGSLYGQGDHDSLLYHMSEDSGLGRATPPRRAPSPGMSSRHLPSPSGPGSLPPGLFSRRRPGAFDDNMSDISTTSSNMDYCGPRLFKQPTAKSNRNIILNAVEYCVFPGVVNQTSKHRVIEEVGRSEAKHFLILFRDSGCQFRALYSYNPELEEVFKLYGTGPKQVTDRMFEKFFKYNSGGKCFSQIHTKHLTVTIDAFTIHNSLWQGKKVNLPSKKDMKLVI